MVNFVKLFVFLVVGLFVFSNFVSAQEGIKNLASDLKGSFQDLVDKLFVNEGAIALKVLFFFLVFLIISAILPLIPLFGKGNDGQPRNSPTKILVSVTVTILSTMFIPTDLLASMVNPYTAMGAVILSVLPIILMFMFIHSTIRSRLFKQAAWWVYGFVLLGLTINSSLDPTTNKWIVWIYGLAMLVVIGMILWGQKIEDKLWAEKLKEGEESANKYLAQRRAMLKFDKERAGVELGSDIA